MAMAFALSLCAGAALAQADGATRIEAGMKVYKTAGCETCHSWTGTGERPDDTPDAVAGVPLVSSALDRAQMVELVSCGTPGGWMPNYLAVAWTSERRCYGKLKSELPPETAVRQPASILTQRQIEDVVAFVLAFYPGKSMSFDNCVRYWGENSRFCALYR